MWQGGAGAAAWGAAGVQRAQAHLQRAALQGQVPRGLRHQLLDALLVTGMALMSACMHTGPPAANADVATASVCVRGACH